MITVREKVVVAELHITKKGEIKHFQIKLPRDAVRIIGIETTVHVNVPWT
jgi:hypothetical protein